MKLTLILALSIGWVAGAYAQGPDGGGMNFFRMSPILNTVDVNQDGALSAAEISGSPARLRTLDKNGDGKLTQDEAGLQMQMGRGGGRGGRGGEGRGEGEGGGDEAPAPAPSAAELTATLMMFDANKNGQLEKSELPERMQGMFERGDTNHDGILTRDEIAKLAEANRQQANTGFGGGEGRGPGGEGRGEGRGFGGGRGPGGRGGNPFDLAFSALDTDHNGEISAEEINNAPASLKTLDKNGDGKITQDEVTPQFGGPGGPGGRRGE